MTGNGVCNEESWSLINPACSDTAWCCSHYRSATAKEGFSDRVSIDNDAATGAVRAEGIRLVLRELGYIEGQNIATEYRYGEEGSIGLLSLRPSWCVSRWISLW